MIRNDALLARRANTTLDLGDEFRGQTVRCGSCGETFAANRTRRTPTRKRPAKSSALPLILLGVGVGAFFILAAGGVFAFVLLSRGATPPLAAVGAPVAAPPGAAELAADVLAKVKLATVRIDVRLGTGEQGTGTGFLVHPEGLIVTNAHVVGFSRREGNRPAKTVAVRFQPGEKTERTLAAQIFGVDGDADLAILRVANADLPEALNLGEAVSLRETQELFVFGYPFGDAAGREITVSTTTVSSLRRENGELTVVQVNGGMSPGNSGGPVADRTGQVVGVSVAGIQGTNINFAIPAELVDRFVREQLALGGRVKPATVVGRPSQPGGAPFLPPAFVRPPFGPRR